MDTILSGLSQLGPALGSVVVLAFICRELLKLFSKHSDALKEVSSALHAQAQSHDRMNENIRTNTAATEKMVNLFERKVS